MHSLLIDGGTFQRCLTTLKKNSQPTDLLKQPFFLLMKSWRSPSLSEVRQGHLGEPTSAAGCFSFSISPRSRYPKWGGVESKFPASVWIAQQASLHPRQRSALVSHRGPGSSSFCWLQNLLLSSVWNERQMEFLLQM